MENGEWKIIGTNLERVVKVCKKSKNTKSTNNTKNTKNSERIQIDPLSFSFFALLKNPVCYDKIESPKRWYSQ